MVTPYRYWEWAGSIPTGYSIAGDEVEAVTRNCLPKGDERHHDYDVTNYCPLVISY